MRIVWTSFGFLLCVGARLAILQSVLSRSAPVSSSDSTNIHVSHGLRGLELVMNGTNATVTVNPQPLCAQPETCLFMTPDTTCSNAPGQRCSLANVLYDCQACNCFCPSTHGLPFLYDFPTPALTSFRNARCDTTNTNVGPTPDPNKAGIYCCFQCFLWRSITTNCPVTGNCWPNIGTAFNDPFVKQANPTPDLNHPHFLIIPQVQVTGVEDAQRNLVGQWTGVYNVMLFPRNHLDPSGGTNLFPGGPVPTGWSGPFPDAQLGIWIGGGINEANARSEHQMHVHYAILPEPVRLVLTKAAWPAHPWPKDVCQDNLRVQTTNPANKRNITFGAYFYRAPIETATWDPRTLAKGCATVWSQVVAPIGVDPFSVEDLTMADISMMIVPGDSVTMTGQPFGYYLLFGNNHRGGFRAETMLCTQQGLTNFWLNTDCGPGNWRLPVVPPHSALENETFGPVCSAAADINLDPGAATLCESLVTKRLSNESDGMVCTTVTIDRFHEVNATGDTVPVFRFCFASASPTAAKTCRGTADRGVLAGAFLNDTAATFGVTVGELDFSDPVNVLDMCPRQLLLSDNGTACGDVSLTTLNHNDTDFQNAVLFNTATTRFNPEDAFMGCFEVRNAVQFTPPTTGFPIALAFINVTTDYGDDQAEGRNVTMGTSICAPCSDIMGHRRENQST